MEYKGISRARHPKWNGWNYIDTYHILDRDNFKEYLEQDEPLQKLVKNFHIRQKTIKIIFNISVYAVFYGIIQLIAH